MRTGLLFSICLSMAAASAQAQTCTKAPAPFLPELFPKEVAGLPMEFSTAPGAGCMVLYRPAEAEARQSTMWASVSAEAEPDAALGETAESVRLRFSATGTTMVMVDGWPVAFSQKATGDEFLTVRGSVRVKVSVKNGDHGELSQAFASGILQQMLAKVPCG